MYRLQRILFSRSLTRVEVRTVCLYARVCVTLKWLARVRVWMFVCARVWVCVRVFNTCLSADKQGPPRRACLVDSNNPTRGFRRVMQVSTRHGVYTLTEPLQARRFWQTLTVLIADFRKPHRCRNALIMYERARRHTS